MILNGENLQWVSVKVMRNTVKHLPIFLLLENSRLNYFSSKRLLTHLLILVNLSPEAPPLLLNRALFDWFIKVYYKG